MGLYDDKTEAEERLISSHEQVRQGVEKQLVHADKNGDKAKKKLVTNIPYGLVFFIILIGGLALAIAWNSDDAMNKKNLATSNKNMQDPAFNNIQIKGSVLCSSDYGTDIKVNFSEFTAGDELVNCIRGDYFPDITPCAPENGYGLSPPTGGHQMIRAERNKAEADLHHGPIVHHTVSDQEINFVGGFNDFGGKLSKSWDFTIDREGGTAKLNLVDDPRGREFFYNCRAER